MVKKIIYPSQDPETGEWRYHGKWYDYFPSEEVEKDEAALEDYWERKFNRMREEPND